jgi:hypothetical protein
MIANEVGDHDRGRAGHALQGISARTQESHEPMAHLLAMY